MLWTLYAQWRFRGISPVELWDRSGLPPLWPSRVSAVEEAFAVHAAELERTTIDVLEAFGDAIG
jgi:hypothetical protein